MAFRFREEFADAIRKISQRENITQARVIEVAITRYGKDIK